MAKKCEQLVNLACAQPLKGLGHAILGNFVYFCYLWALNVKLAEQESFLCKLTAT